MTSTQKFLLVALADFADEEDACFPAQERLATMIGIQRQAVSRNLGALEESGLIARSRRVAGRMGRELGSIRARRGAMSAELY